MPISLTADAHFGARLVCSFIEPDVWNQRTIGQYHSDLSDQYALEIRAGLAFGLDSELHYFSIFHGE